MAILTTHTLLKKSTTLTRNMVLVDSNIWIESLRKKGVKEIKFALQGLLDEYEAAICGPVKLEVIGGSRRSERKATFALLNHLPYRGSGQNIWTKTLKNAIKVRDQGINPKWNDLIIATIALQHGDRVYSTDTHFQEMAPILGFQLYEPGYGGSYNPD